MGFTACGVVFFDSSSGFGSTGVAGSGSMGSFNTSDKMDSSIMFTSLAVSESTVSMSGLRLASLPNISAIRTLAVVGVGPVLLATGGCSRFEGPATGSTVGVMMGMDRVSAGVLLVVNDESAAAFSVCSAVTIEGGVSEGEGWVFGSLALAVRARTEATVLFNGLGRCFLGVFLMFGLWREADTGTGILDTFDVSLGLNDLVTRFGVEGWSTHAGFSHGTV